MAEERLQEIRNARLAKRERLMASGGVPYPAEARRTHTLGEISKNFADLQKTGAVLVAVGRVMAVRAHGGVVFLDVRDESGKLQFQISKDGATEDIFARLQDLDSGDFIEAAGGAILTGRGVETLAVKEFHIISKAIRPVPSQWFGLKDHETRFRQREVDLILHEEARRALVARSAIINWLRSYLVGHQFVEVETPILQPIPGGTLAKPFTTHHQALDIDLFLRIAPELYLKRLIVGGFERVFEIGRNFRNEGIDKQHNPEFTMLEFYQAYADYEDLMDMSEDMLPGLAAAVTGTTDVTWQEQHISFAKPWQRVKYTDIVSERIGIDVLKVKDPAAYVPIFAQEGLAMPETKTYAKLVDELYKELVRPALREPTILYDYPVEMVPLAKTAPSNPAIAEMFQILVGGVELVKAYTELNDPVEQRERFEVQQAARELGDEEAHAIDEAYLRAMEYGMPPVAGYGLGVDRLAMLLTNSATLRDTIAFPLLRPE